MNILYKMLSFSPGKYFGKIEIGQKKCPKTKSQKKFPEIHVL
jgi:hypothetical protein